MPKEKETAKCEGVMRKRLDVREHDESERFLE